MGHIELDQWRELGDGGTYHNVPCSLQKSQQDNPYESSHKLYHDHTRNIKEQPESKHSNCITLQEPEQTLETWNNYNLCLQKGDEHDANYDYWYSQNNYTDDYYSYYEQYQSESNICFSNLIEITPTSNLEKDINPEPRWYGAQRNRLQSGPEIYRNPSMTNSTNTMSTFNSTRLGQPIYYSSDYNQHFLWKGRKQLERDKYLI